MSGDYCLDLVITCCKGRDGIGSARQHKLAWLGYVSTIGFSDLFDLWVIKIKKNLCSFAHGVRWEYLNRARTTNHVVRTCEMFVHSIVKKVRLYDYQTWRIHFSKNSRGVQRYVGFFLCVFGRCWLAGQKVMQGGYTVLLIFSFPGLILFKELF